MPSRLPDPQLFGDPAERNRYKIAVLREPQSRGGSAGMHTKVQAGQCLTVGSPRNHFALVPARHSLLLAGGIGITPILAMARSLHAQGDSFEMHYLLAEAEYQLETDNILNLSHIELLHPGTLGSDAVKQAQSDVQQEGHTVYSRRLTRNETLMPSLAQRYGIPEDQLVDRWLDTRWNAPAVMELWVGVAPAGSPDPRAVGKQVPFIHLFTPETATTAHYWFATSYPKRMGEEGRRRAESDVQYLRGPFASEDLPMLEAQQEAIGEQDFWAMKPILLPGDAAAVRARRVLAALIKAEQDAAQSQEVGAKV